MLAAALAVIRLDGADEAPPLIGATRQLPPQTTRGKCHVRGKLACRRGIGAPPRKARSAAEQAVQDAAKASLLLALRLAATKHAAQQIAEAGLLLALGARIVLLELLLA